MVSLDDIKKKLESVEKAFRTAKTQKQKPKQVFKDIKDYDNNFLPRVDGNLKEKDPKHSGYNTGEIDSLQKIFTSLVFNQTLTTDKIDDAIKKLKETITKLPLIPQEIVLKEQPLDYVQRDIERYHETIESLVVQCLERIEKGQKWEDIFNKMQTMDQFITTITHSKQEIVAFLQAIIPFN